MPYSYRPNPASKEVVTLPFVSWTQVRDVRPGHWPDFYIPDSCIPPHLLGYAIGERLREGTYFYLDWIGYAKFELAQTKAAARCTALTGMPYWFNKVTGEVELEMEVGVGGSGGPQVNELVVPAAVPFSPIPRDSNVWESQQAPSAGAGAGAIGVDVPNFSRPLAFRPTPAARTTTAARIRSPVHRERRSRSRSASPSSPPRLASLSSSQQQAPRSWISTGMPPPLRPRRRMTDDYFPNPENMELMCNMPGGAGPGDHNFGIILPHLAERERALVSEAPRAGSTQGQRVARHDSRSGRPLPPVPLFPWTGSGAGAGAGAGNGSGAGAEDEAGVDADDGDDVMLRGLLGN
jgi:hypothetical protein